MTLEGALRNLPQLLEAEDYGRTVGVDGGKRSHRQYAAICAPYFCHAVHMVDGFLEARGARGQVVHDEVPKFEQVYHDYFSMLKSIEKPQSVEWRSGIYRRNGISRLSDLRFKDSSSVLPLQVADLICGRVRHAVQTTLRSKVAPPFSRTVLRLLRLMYGESPVFGKISASEASKSMLHARIVRSLPRGGTC